MPKKFTKKWRDRWCNMETTKWKPKNGEHTTTTKLKKQNGNQPHTHTHRKSNNKKKRFWGLHTYTQKQKRTNNNKKGMKTKKKDLLGLKSTRQEKRQIVTTTVKSFKKKETSMHAD